MLPERFALVLGGGGLKGFAHVGVLRALEERGLRPSVVCGTSIGALVGSAYAAGMPLREMQERAIALRQRDLFQLDHFGMVTRRMRNASLYLEAPLRKLVRESAPDVPFSALELPLLVNTVDLERGAQVVWGLPGLRDVRVAEAVYASCALPGFFPPARLGGRFCADGSIMDNLPVTVAGIGVDAVVAIDVGSTSMTISRSLPRRGFAAVYMRAAQVMMHALEHAQLRQWDRPPMLLVRPPVWHFPWFTFSRTAQFIEAGYAATLKAIDRVGDSLLTGRGVYPRKPVNVVVDREACIGCGLCVALAPRAMRMTPDGKAVVIRSPLEWSRADGDFVHQCPTDAIHVTLADGEQRLAKPPLEDFNEDDEPAER